MPRRTTERVGKQDRARGGLPTRPGTRPSDLGRGWRTQPWRRRARSRTRPQASYRSHCFLMRCSCSGPLASPLLVTRYGGATVNSVTIEATDGVSLQGNVYDPQGEPAYQLLVFPGIGVPQRVFRHIAAWFAGNGVRVVTIDYRGMGTSTGPNALRTANLTNWAARDAVGA